MVRIVASPRMASLTSLHLGGRALALATFESAADLETLPEAADRIGGRA
jgi:UDP-N-acetylmuramate dehydrogenase